MSRLTTEQKKEIKKLGKKWCKEIIVSSNMNKICWGQKLQREIRHNDTNYEIICSRVNALDIDKEIKSEVIKRVHNAVNNQIDAIKNEVITLLLSQNKSLETRLTLANKEIEELRSNFQTVIANSNKVSNELRQQLGNAICSKEIYIQFISELCDVSFKEVRDIVRS